MPHTYTHMHISVFFPTDIEGALLEGLCKASLYKELCYGALQSPCKVPIKKGFVSPSVQGALLLGFMNPLQSSCRKGLHWGEFLYI